MRRILAALVCAVLVYAAGCQPGDPPPVSAPPATPTHTPVPTPENTPAETPEPTPEAAESEAAAQEGVVRAEYDPGYADTRDVAAMTALEYTSETPKSRVVTADDAGWQMLGQSTKSIQGSITGVDDYLGHWLLSFDEPLDRIAKMVNVTFTDIYTCSEAYPNISSVCMNGSGIYWIEHDNRAWRLMRLREGGGETAVLEEGTARDGALPQVTSPEYHTLVLYEPDGHVRVFDAENDAWFDAEFTAATQQLSPPEAVEGYVCWVEETSQGWAVIVFDSKTSTEREFLMRGLLRPQKATFDGQLLLTQTVSGTLVCSDVVAGRNYVVCAGVQTYQHIPGEGAIIAVDAGWEQQLVRFALDSTANPQLLSLAAVRDGGEVVRVFHHSYELDVEQFLIRKGDGTFQRASLSMREQSAPPQPSAQPGGEAPESPDAEPSAPREDEPTGQLSQAQAERPTPPPPEPTPEAFG